MNKKYRKKLGFGALIIGLIGIIPSLFVTNGIFAPFIFISDMFRLFSPACNIKDDFCSLETFGGYFVTLIIFYLIGYLIGSIFDKKE